jgi:hypothetical protein
VVRKRGDWIKTANKGSSIEGKRLGIDKLRCTIGFHDHLEAMITTDICCSFH